MNLAKIDTAKSFLIGPILDADGVAVTSGLTRANINVAKNGTVAASNASSTLTHSHTGNWVFAANAADISALGEVEFSLNATTNAMKNVSFQVVTANVYDTFSSTDILNVNIETIKTQAVTAASGVTINPSVGAATIVPTNTQFEARTRPTADYFDHTTDEVTTDAASRTASQADVSLLALASALATAQTDLDTITGTDGVTLATLQALYAPNKIVPPSLAEFNARSLPSADYVVVGDTLAGVTLVGTVTTNTDLVTAASIKTALEADGGDLSSLMEALVNKRIWTEADGALEMFNDAGASQGSIAAQVTSDGTFTTAKRAFI